MHSWSKVRISRKVCGLLVCLTKAYFDFGAVSLVCGTRVFKFEVQSEGEDVPTIAHTPCHPNDISLNDLDDLTCEKFGGALIVLCDVS